MKFFSKKEFLGVVCIFLVVGIVTYSNLLISERRARDSQRQSDLGAISDALYAYFSDFGFFPPAKDGMILACKGANFADYLAKVTTKDNFDRNLFFQNLVACRWGKDSLRDVFDTSYMPYIKTLPDDPGEKNGISYYYLSDTKRFQLYSYLEGGKEEDSFSSGIAARNLACGNKICSFGKSYADTPLDRSIEEYEQELEIKLKTGR